METRFLSILILPHRAGRSASGSSTGRAGPRRSRSPGLGRALLLLGALGLSWAGAVAASDGVLEINQTCAVQTGCFAGDSAGFPVTISASGSYRLTSNLVVPDENTNGIAVETPDVGIDLNNFLIQGPVVCSGTPLVCTPSSGSGRGVSAAAVIGVSVRNGSIRGMGGFGVRLKAQSEVMNLRVRSNRVDGVWAGEGSTISGITANENGSYGIFAGPGSTISGITAYRNRNDGIVASDGSTVSGNTAHDNGDTGIVASDGSTISGNTAYRNGGSGIFAGPGSTVLGNTVRLNTGFGLSLSSLAGYRENVISDNTAGTVSGGVNMFNNVCNGSLTCP